MSSISLVELKEFIERTTEEKMLEMKITRRDMRMILERVEGLSRTIKEMIGKIGGLGKNQLRIIGDVDGLKGYLNNIIKAMSEAFKAQKIRMSEILDHIKKLETASQAQYQEEKGKLDRILDDANSLKIGQKNIGDNLNSIIEKISELRQTASRIESMDEILTQKTNIIIGQIDNASRNLDNIMEKIESTYRSIEESSVLVSQKIDNTTRIEKEVLREIGATKNIIQEVIKDIKNMHKNQEVIAKSLGEVLGLVKKFGGIVEIVTEVLDALKTVNETQKDISRKLDILLKEKNKERSTD